METVGSTKLKNSLNSYLARIRRGARFIVTDRGQPIAKLIPIEDRGDDSIEAALSALIAEGLLTIDAGIEQASIMDSRPIVTLKGNRASNAIVEDRRHG